MTDCNFIGRCLTNSFGWNVLPFNNLTRYWEFETVKVDNLTPIGNGIMTITESFDKMMLP